MIFSLLFDAVVVSLGQASKDALGRKLRSQGTLGQVTAEQRYANRQEDALKFFRPVIGDSRFNSDISVSMMVGTRPSDSGRSTISRSVAAVKLAFAVSTMAEFIAIAESPPASDELISADAEAESMAMRTSRNELSATESLDAFTTAGVSSPGSTRSVVPAANTFTANDGVIERAASGVGVTCGSFAGRACEKGDRVGAATSDESANEWSVDGT